MMQSKTYRIVFRQRDGRNVENTSISVPSIDLFSAMNGVGAPKD
jgi:hypothetical protein